MKTVEIILKLAFLALSVSFIIAQSIYSPLFDLLLIICIVLGLVLLLNHHSSYKIRKGTKDLIYRQIEGGILIIFAAVVSTLGF